VSTLELFERWSSRYDDSPLRPAYESAHEAVLGSVGRLLPRPRRVLDLGCGTGLLLHRAARLFPDASLVGVDPSGGMLATAAARDGLRLVRASAERLPFPDAVFDVVLSTMSMRHWTDRAAGVREVGRVLAPGGVVGLADSPTGGRRRPRRKHVWPTWAAAGLTIVDVSTAHGYGPVGSLMVVLARRAGTVARRG
jgi:ubiquinone/menaquinone biosynthesis C-methylase UbiE